MFGLRAGAVALAVAVAGCGDDTATSGIAGGSTTAMNSTTGTNSTTTGGGSTTSEVEPTGGSTGSGTGEAVDPCECEAPVVHEGDLDVTGLAAYQGACLVEVTGTVEIEALGDPSLLTSLAHLQRTGSLWIHDSPGIVDLGPLSCLRETRRLNLHNNPDLVDIGALAGIEIAERVSFSVIPIVELSTFAPNYQGVRSLYLVDMPELRDLDAVAGWPGLHGGDTVYERFGVTITDLPKLENIAGLAGPVGSAAAKTSPDPLDGWPSIELGELPALATIAGLEPFMHGNLTLRRLPAVTDLAPLGQFERGNLTLAGLGITSLAGLDSLTRVLTMIVGGCEEGEAMPALETLAGADILEEVSGLWVVDAPVLTDLSVPPFAVIEEVNFVDTPALDDAEIAAFMAGVDAVRQCAGDIVECSCLGLIPETVTHGCPQMWSGGSAVIGASEGGPFAGTTAFFGWRGSNVGFAELVLVILAATSDVEAAKQDGVWNGDGGRPKAIIYTDSYYNWIRGSSPLAALYDDGGGIAKDIVELDVQGRLGNWVMSDPADPPRLHGTLKSSDANAAVMLDGPFEAVFCEDFVLYLSD